MNSGSLSSKFRSCCFAVIVFTIGVMSCGVYWIDSHEVGVSINLWQQSLFQELHPGLHFRAPFLSRVTKHPLSDSVILGDYQLGHFNEIKHIEGITRDGYKVILHLIIRWEFDRETASKLLEQFIGHFPRDYMEFHIRQYCLSKLRQVNHTEFSALNYPDCLAIWSDECQSHLLERGFKLATLEFATFNSQQPGVYPASEYDREQYRLLNSYEE